MKGHNSTIGGGGFHHIAMRASDFDASLRFYTQVLGFAVKIAWGEGDKRAVMLDTGDGNYLELFAGGQTGAHADKATAGAVLHFALRTANCDAALERARAAGAEVTMEPKDIEIPSAPPTPIRIAFCKGPDGEVIEFFQNERT